jgi:hypothetical protein
MKRQWVKRPGADGMAKKMRRWEIKVRKMKSKESLTPV